MLLVRLTAVAGSNEVFRCFPFLVRDLILLGCLLVFTLFLSSSCPYDRIGVSWLGAEAALLVSLI